MQTLISGLWLGSEDWSSAEGCMDPAGLQHPTRSP